MKKFTWITAILAIVFCCQVAHAEVIFDWAAVGNAGNGIDPAAGFWERGAVAYDFRMSKHEVTNAQYTEFLNAVDPVGTNTLGLYNPQMSAHGNGGINFDGAASSGSKYHVKPGRDNNPVVFVSFKDAVRFTNWLENGQGTGDTETGTYAITVGNHEVRSSNATYFLPSGSEWHKAAFHKNDGVTTNFWAYATSTDVTPFSDQPPGTDAPDSSNTANFLSDDVNDVNGYNDGYAVTGSPILVSGQNYLTNVGAYTQSRSPYGLFDMAGNVYEWTDSINIFEVESRELYGGAYNNNFLESLYTSYDNPIVETPRVGFRMASAVPVPEPGSVAMALFSIGAALIGLRRSLSCGRSPTQHLDGTTNWSSNPLIDGTPRFNLSMRSNSVLTKYVGLAFAAALTYTVTASSALADPYSVKEISIPGASSVVARAIDNQGRVLGSVGGVPAGNLFFLDHGEFDYFSLPDSLLADGGAFSPGTVSPFDFSSTGAVVGAVFEDDGSFEPPSRGFRTSWVNTDATDLLAFGVSSTPPDTAITGVSSDGNIVTGWYRGDNNAELQREANGFLYDFATDTFQKIQAFGEPGTFVWGMNASGALVGNGSQGAFLWENGVTTLLTGPGGEQLTAEGISDSGIITGLVIDTGEVYVAADDQFVTFAVPGAVLTLVEDINDHGQAVGFYFDENFSFRSFIATPVPEPTGLAAVFVGGAFFTLLRRRRRVSMRPRRTTIGAIASSTRDQLPHVKFSAMASLCTVLTTGAAYAQHSDIQIDVIDDAFSIGKLVNDGDIREFDLYGDGTVYRTNDPGFNTNGFGVLENGTIVFLAVTSPLMYWDGVLWDAAQDDTYLRVSNQGLGELTITGVTGRQSGLAVGQAGVLGNLHAHLTFELGTVSGEAPSVGAYAIGQALNSDQYLSSNEFFVVFNNGLTAGGLASAIAAAESQLVVPEPSSLTAFVLPALGLLAGRRRPKGKRDCSASAGRAYRTCPK